MGLVKKKHSSSRELGIITHTLKPTESDDYGNCILTSDIKIIHIKWLFSREPSNSRMVIIYSCLHIKTCLIHSGHKLSRLKRHREWDRKEVERWQWGFIVHLHSTLTLLLMGCVILGKLLVSLNCSFLRKLLWALNIQKKVNFQYALTQGSLICYSPQGRKE